MNIRSVTGKLPVVAGSLLVLLALQTTHQTYQPLPPGSGHIDGRGLFAAPLITAIATCGGVLIAVGIQQWLGRWQTVGARMLSATAVGWLAVTPSVVYMTTFADSNVSGGWGAYVDWYGMSLVVTVVLLAIGGLLWTAYRQGTQLLAAS